MIMIYTVRSRNRQDGTTDYATGRICDNDLHSESLDCGRQ